MDSDTRFNYSVTIVLSHEGGLCDDSDDPGGITNFGITAQFLLDNRMFFNKCDAITYIEKMNENTAKSIYKTYFWEHYHYNLIEPLQIATKIFDMCVNMGNVESHKIVQRSINKMSHDQLLVDGIIGSKTIAAANALPDTYLHEELREESKKFYTNLAEENPKLAKFLTGWLKRASW
jgi:lysozyme family protein